MVKLQDSTETTDLFIFSDSSTGTGQLTLPSSISTKEVVVQKNPTSGVKGYILHKKNVRNRNLTLNVRFSGTNRHTNKSSFVSLIEAQTTVYFNAESNSAFTDYEGLYEFTGILREDIDERLKIVDVSIGLIENLNDA